MDKIISEYKRLKLQLVNPGEEESPEQVGWNDQIMEAMEDLLKEVHPDIAKLIRLNHI